jgi:hypothetical protein
MVINYILEHYYLWLTNTAFHRSLWSPPIFYPQHDTAIYTELMLGALPPYALWRMFGAGPLTAFQLWVITVSALNFIAGYWMLRGLFRCGWIGSAAGALLLTYGSPRLVRLGDPQFWPAFYMVMAFAGLYMLFMRDPAELTARRVYAGLALFLGGFSLQLYTSFYCAWFVVFATTLGLLFASLLSAPRSHLLNFLRRWWRTSLCAMALAAILVAPYVEAGWSMYRQSGGRNYAEAERYLPFLKTWIAQGPHHMLYGGLTRLAGFGPYEAEKFNGIGLITTVLVISAFVLFRGRPVVRLWGLVALSAILLCYKWPGGFSLWRFVYSGFPGAAGLRAISRISVFLLLPASIAVALAVDRIGTRVSGIAAIACLVAIGLEQAGSLNDVRDFRKDSTQASIRLVARTIRPECRTFIFSWSRDLTTPEIMHVMGMWAQLDAGIPTLNGYSGNVPPGWPLMDVAVTHFADRARVLNNIERWASSHAMDIKNVCWVLPEESDGTSRIGRSTGEQKTSLQVLSVPWVVKAGQ